MSIFSPIRRAFYNYKLKQADEYVEDGIYGKAERTYKSLILYHPEAVTHLARMFFNYPNSMGIDRYQKVLDCRKYLRNNHISNEDSFDRIEKAVFNEINSKINSLINKKKYSEISVWIDFILLRNKNLAPSQKEYYVLLDSKCRYNYALGLAGLDRNKSEKIFEDIYKKSESYSFPSDFAVRIRNKILNIAKSYVNEKDILNANHYLELILSKEPKAKELLIKSNIFFFDQIKANPSAINFLFDTINSIEDKRFVINYFEQLLIKIPAAVEQYILSIIYVSSNYINSGDYPKAIDLLSSALNKKADNRLYDLQRDIAQQYIIRFDYGSAINILIQLIGKHRDAEPLLAKCYLQKVEKADSLDNKRDELLKAFNFKDSHDALFNNSLYNEIFPSIINNLLALAKKYVNYEFFKDAYSLLSMLFPYAQEAYEEYINTKTIEICKETNIDKQITLLDELIQTGKQKIKNPENSKSIDNVFKTLIDKILSKLSQERNVETKTNELAKLNQKISNENFLSKESSLLMIQRTIAEVYFKQGNEYEKKSKLDDAINIYTKIINELKNWTEEGSQKNDVLGRLYICRLKKDDINQKEIESFLLQKMATDIKKDLAYRYSIYLLKQHDYKQAWIIAQKYLPTTNETEQIRKAYESNQTSNAQKLLDSFNEKIQQINDGTLTLNEAIDLYEKLSETETAIAAILTDVKGKIINKKNILIVYILRKYFEDEKYIEYLYAIKKQYKQFYKDDNMLHNVAIASLGIVKAKKLDANNYKDVISNWLTAVFRDKLFIKSLDNTSWDDNYSFTLYDSLGKMEEYNNLPDNVNFDKPSSTNISIREVQNSLLSDFEQALNENCSSTLLSKVLNFYEEEKEAISQLYQSIIATEDFFECTPFFAGNYPEIQDAFSKNITKELSNRKFDESILTIGILYNIQGREYKDYSDAKILSAKSVEIIKALNTAQIRLIITASNLKKIEPYSELYENLVSDIKNSLSEHINSANNSYKDIINNYLIICQVFPDQNIKFTLSNFAFNECLRRLNNDSITSQEALQLMTDVQKVIRDNVKINNFIPDIQLSDLIEKVNNKRISVLDALTATYNLYKSYPNHQRICENLVVACSNAIHSEIIGNTYSSNQVQNILNNIIANKSSTFRVAAKELAIQYSQIIIGLPKDIQTMILGGFVYGSSLNTHGVALKSGLNYLQRLSQ